MTGLTKQKLRAMRDRWRRDLAVLEGAFPGVFEQPEASEPKLETIRNLATAIAEIDGIITNEAPS